MAYIFTFVFVLIFVALIIYIGMAIWQWMQKEKSEVCVLETKRKETNFQRVSVRRKESVDYSLIFRTEEGEKIRVEVSEEVYHLVPKETEGVLTHRGSIFRKFTYNDIVVDAHAGLEELEAPPISKE